MNNSKFYSRFSFLMFISLILSASLFAQRGRGHHGNSNNHYPSHSNNHYPGNYNHFPDPHVSVNFGSHYNYRPYYRPRPVYRPVYRSPYAYMHFGPAFGVRINLLPVGYSRVYVGSSPYYYNQGVYYRPYDNGGYEVIAPPLGATVPQLPAGATITVIDGVKYYQLGGTFYQEEISENNSLSYRVVGTDGVINTEEMATEEMTDAELPAVGSRYDQLPTDCKVEVINQHKYYVSPEGVYYQEVIEGNKVRYEVTTVD